MAATSDATVRILTRGETTQFKVAFFADDGLTTPLAPVTPDYPAYSILDPQGTVIQTGIGVMGMTAGNYIVSFQVPKDAILSYFDQRPQRYDDKSQGMDLTADGARYRIEWTMVTAENYQVQFVEEFDVRDTAITQSHNRQLKYLTLAGDAVRILYRVTVLPYKTRLRLIMRGNDANAVVQDQLDFSDPAHPEGLGNVKYAKDGDSYVLYYDLPEGVTLANTCYMALWNIQETAFTPAYTEFQLVTAVSTSVLPLITSLRMLIDKFQKRLGRIVSYEDSDLLEYIGRGVSLVNVQYPTTGYTLNDIPDPLLTYVLLAAGWYGLQAQKILLAELNFNFSGQSVTLTLDSQSGIDSAASTMQAMFNQGLAAAKMTYVRQARGMGTVSVRGYGQRASTDLVYPIWRSHGSGVDFLSLLGKIGLL